MGHRLQRGSRLFVVLGLIRNAGQQINDGSGKDVSDETIADAGPLRLHTPDGVRSHLPR